MEDKVKQKIKKIVKYLIEKTKPTKIILFGSRAKKNNRKSSDIDLAVDTKTEVDFRTKRKIKEEVKKFQDFMMLTLYIYVRLKRILEN